METGLKICGNYTGTHLVGEVKNLSGEVDKDFIKAVEELMEKHKVNYVQLYWDHWIKES